MTEKSGPYLQSELCKVKCVREQVFMARDGKVVGSMVLSDRVRGDAADTVRQLQDRGYRTIMLTGASL